MKKGRTKYYKTIILDSAQTRKAQYRFEKGIGTFTG